MNYSYIKLINFNELSVKLFSSLNDKTGFNYKINCENLYQQAFTHKKLTNIDPFNTKEFSYERLEFLGDSVLNFIICDYLYERYVVPLNENDIDINDNPNICVSTNFKVQESFLTDIKIKLVNSDILSWLCKCLEIEKYILEVNNFKFTNSSINEDIFEALIGAILLDHNFYVVKNFIIDIIENPNFIDYSDLILRDTNYKKKLFIYFQKKMDGRLPIFHTLYLPPNYSKHKYFHVVVCSPNGKILGFGISNTLKMAQQSACKNAFELNDMTYPNMYESEYKILYNLINHQNDNHYNMNINISPSSFIDNNSEISNISNISNISSITSLDSETSNSYKLFNPNNYKITKEFIFEILNKYNSTNIQLKPIQNKDIINYQRSFIHKSYYQICYNIIENMTDLSFLFDNDKSNHILTHINVVNISSNELLNFLGNTLLIYILSHHLYNLYPNEKEGVLTKIKTSEIQSKNLSNMCKLLNLNKYYILNANDECLRYNIIDNLCDNDTIIIEDKVIKNEIKNLDEIFCSFIASIYLNQGIDFVTKFVIELWDLNKRFENFIDENYKHKLLLIIQENPKYKKYLHPYPKYILSNDSNSDKKIFITEVYDPDGVMIGKGIGKNKRLSEQEASKNAIEILNKSF